MNAYTNQQPLTTEELRRAHPMPWRVVTIPARGFGQVVVLDQQNKEVPMFLMLDFIVGITQKLTAQGSKTQEQPAA